MFYYGIMTTILLLIFLYYSKDIVKTALVSCGLLLFYFLFFYSIPFEVIPSLVFGDKLSLLFENILFAILTYTGYYILVHSKFYKDFLYIIESLFFRMESRLLFLFFICILFPGLNFVQGLIFFSTVVMLLNIPNFLGFVTVLAISSFKLLLTTDSYVVSSMFATIQEYQMFENRNIFVYLLFIVIISILLYTVAHIYIKLTKKISHDYRYLVVLIFIIFIGVAIGTSVTQPVLMIIISVVSIAFLHYEDTSIRRPLSRFRNFSLVESMFLAILYIGSVALFPVIKWYSFILTAVILIYILVRDETYNFRFIDTKKYYQTLAIIIGLIVFLYLQNVLIFDSIVNNQEFGTTFWETTARSFRNSLGQPTFRVTVLATYKDFLSIDPSAANILTPDYLTLKLFFLKAAPFIQIIQFPVLALVAKITEIEEDIQFPVVVGAHLVVYAVIAILSYSLTII